MKLSSLLLLIPTLFLTACGSDPAPSGADHDIRPATPGIVDHNVIPRR